MIIDSTCNAQSAFQHFPVVFPQSSDSSCDSHCATVSSKSTASLTALKRTSLRSLSTSPRQQPDCDLAQAAAHTFATESITEGVYD